MLVGFICVLEGRARGCFKDARSILLINWHLIKHVISFPFQYFFFGGGGELVGGSVCFGFLGNRSCLASYCNLQALNANNCQPESWGRI